MQIKVKVEEEESVEVSVESHPLEIGAQTWTVRARTYWQTFDAFLVDNGSSETLSSITEYNSMSGEVRPSLVPISDVVRQADGKPLAAKGSALMGDTDRRIIVASIRNRGILGMNFMLTAGCTPGHDPTSAKDTRGYIVPLSDGARELILLVIGSVLKRPLGFHRGTKRSSREFLNNTGNLKGWE